jgi:two-component system cell cycle response regulator
MPSILIVDDEPENLDLLEALLEPAGHTVRRATSGRDALQAVEQDSPDLIILDLMMPEVSGFEICEMLRSQETTVRIPILVVTALDQGASRERALALGADDFLAKPIEPTEVLARVEALLRVRHLPQNMDRVLAYLHELELTRHAPHPPTAAEAGGPLVLLADDEELTRQYYGDLLTEHGFRVVPAGSGTEALAVAPHYPFETVVLDIVMPGLSGLETLDQLRLQFPDVPVVILTAHPSSETAITALKLGAFDFIVKGLQPELVIMAVRRAVRRCAELRQQRQAMQVLEARIRELETRL